MIRSTVLLFAIMTCGKLVFGQITSDKSASKELKWLIENPQMKSIRVFEKKSMDIFSWYVLNYPKLVIRTKGIGEFMDSSDGYKFFGEVTLIYSLSEFDNQINRNITENESAFLAIMNVLTYYNRIIQIDKKYIDPVLEKYSNYSEEELRKEIEML
jgi:hypothetical protein